MNGDDGRDLGPGSVLLVIREGGFVVAPGLSAPRRIECQALSLPQRLRLQAVLDELDLRGGASSVNGADQRSFRVILEMSSGVPEKEWELNESAAPRSLIGLWKHGARGLDESDD